MSRLLTIRCISLVGSLRTILTFPVIRYHIRFMFFSTWKSFWAQLRYIHNIYSLWVYPLKQPLNPTSLFKMSLYKVINLMNLCQIKQTYYHCYIPSMEGKAIKMIIVLSMDVLKLLPQIQRITNGFLKLLNWREVILLRYFTINLDRTITWKVLQ